MRRAVAAAWSARWTLLGVLCVVAFVGCLAVQSYYAALYEAPARQSTVAGCADAAARHMAAYGAVNVAGFPECDPLTLGQQATLQAGFTAVSELTP